MLPHRRCIINHPKADTIPESLQIALFALEQAGPPLAETDPPDIEECGETVKRTGKPCLLGRGHSGRHRSVL